MTPRQTLCAALAATLRALPDDELVEAAAPWIAARVSGGAASATETEPERERPARRARPAKRSKAPARPAPASSAKGPAAANIEAVFRVLAASDKPLALAVVVERAKLGSRHQTTYALRRLAEQGRAELTGLARSARWGIAS